MAVSDNFLGYVLEQLADIGRVHPRRMFGGVGLYSGELFIGLLDDNTLYLRADDSNRDDYLRRAMLPFRPFRDRPEYSMSYYQVPADVIEDAEALVAWATKSVRVAAAAPKTRRSPRSRPPGRKDHRRSR
jgi:DNA transformation protein and related proteins